VKVVCDAGNGAGGPAMHRILERLNVDATELFFEMDGRFPNHHPDPTLPETIDTLIRTVRETGAELGIAFDGDADRIGAVDEKGAILWGDMLLLIYAREILARKPGSTFIGEVKCSQVMYDEIERLGGKAVMYKTGHSLIKAKMKEIGAELAGEMSGHMFFADRYYGYDDALYAACRLIEIVAASGKPLSAQLEGLPRMLVTPEIRVDCPDETKFEVVKRVAAHFRGTHRVVDIDGVRILFDRGWGLVRASNTQPVLVTRFEASDEETLNRYRREVEEVVTQAKAAVGVAAG
jgi:phosphomannomutase/phosphoglucomutase